MYNRLVDHDAGKKRPFFFDIVPFHMATSGEPWTSIQAKAFEEYAGFVPAYQCYVTAYVGSECDFALAKSMIRECVSASGGVVCFGGRSFEIYDNRIVRSGGDGYEIIHWPDLLTESLRLLFPIDFFPVDASDSFVCDYGHLDFVLKWSSRSENSLLT